MFHLPSDPQQVPPACGLNMPDGATHSVLLLSVDVPEHAHKTHNPAQLDTTPLSYPTPLCMHPAILNGIMPEMLMAISWPSPIQGSEVLLHGMPLDLTLEQMHHMLLDLEAGYTLL